MADMSDSPRDLVLYYRVVEHGYECAFGVRFGNGCRTVGYPRLKPALNRVVNTGIRMLFQHGYNDTTNAFKAYGRNVIDQIQPLLSNQFNRTVEMPLKAIVRGYDFAVVPLTWTNGQYGTSKLRFG
jgi:dolichol-phosphate mannosyltransferase